METPVNQSIILFEFKKGDKEYLTVEYDNTRKKFRIVYETNIYDIDYDTTQNLFYASWKERVGAGVRGPTINKTIYFNLDANNLMTLITIDHERKKKVSNFVYSSTDGYEFKP